MTFDLLRRRKQKDISAAPELLQIHAIGWKMPSIVTISLYLLVTLLYIVMMISLFKEPGIVDRVHLIIFSVMGTAIYAGALMSIRVVSKSKRQPLVFTERGIVGPYLVAIKYDEIEGYTWEDFRGFTRVVPGPDGGGTCLFIRDKSIIPNYIDKHGHTVFVNYGFFFDQNQIDKTESIMERYGVKKLKDRSIFS